MFLDLAVKERNKGCIYKSCAGVGCTTVVCVYGGVCICVFVCAHVCTHTCMHVFAGILVILELGVQMPLVEGHSLPGIATHILSLQRCQEEIHYIPVQHCQ